MKEYKKYFESYPTAGLFLTTLYLSFVYQSKIFHTSFSFLAIVSYRKDEVHLKVGKCTEHIKGAL